MSETILTSVLADPPPEQADHPTDPASDTPTTEPTTQGGLSSAHLINAALALEASESLSGGLEIARTRQIKRNLRSKSLTINRDIVLRDQVLEVIEQGSATMGQLSSALGLRPLALRPELREMEDLGLIELNGDRYMLGPRWIAANPIGPVAHRLLLNSLRVGNIVAEADIASRTNLSGETIRRGMRWMEHIGEVSIRYVGQKAIYDPRVGGTQPTPHPPRIGEKVPPQRPKTLWFQRSRDSS